MYALFVVGGPDSAVAVTVTSAPVPGAASAGTLIQTATRPAAPASNARVGGLTRLTNCRPSAALTRNVAAAPTFRTANVRAVDVPGTRSSAASGAVTSTVSEWKSAGNNR